MLLVGWALLVPFFGTAQPFEKVCFSVPGGFYEESFQLEMSPFDSNHHIRFTTNGNRPTAQSRLYTEPLLLDGSLYSTSDIYTITMSPDSLVFIPDSVRHCIVIRAAVYDENDSCVSAVATNSYFIHSLGCDTHGFPVISICADTLDLFDYYTGIMVPGVNYDPHYPDNTGNYCMTGREWERVANFEFYECASNEGLNQICGLRTHGHRSRRYQSKGLKVYAREEYGNKRFEYNFYNDSVVDSYKHLVFKPFGAFWPFQGGQDYFCNKLALQLGLPASNSRPTILYLNGEYWGVYFIQEKMDERFLEDHFGIDKDHCNIINDWHGNVDCGNNINFMAMMNWLKNVSLAEEENYEHLCELIDVQNFADYILFETFIANYDWPGNNMRCFQENDDPWRWIFFDGDATLTYSEMDPFANAGVWNPPLTWGNYPESKMMFGKLLENEDFKDAFEARMVELCSGLFLYDNTSLLFNGIVDSLRPHIEDHSHRFGYPLSMAYWNEGNYYIEHFLQRRVNEYLQWWQSFDFLDDISSETDMVYPNPSSGPICLRLSEEVANGTEIAIYDMLGRKVFSEPCVSEDNCIISLNPSLSAGVYVLVVNDKTIKIVRQ